MADIFMVFDVATRHPRCGYPYCACVGQCFAASQPGVAPGVLVDYSFRCYSCSKEWEATTTTTDCPACGTTNNHCAANPRGVEGTKNG